METEKKIETREPSSGREKEETEKKTHSDEEGNQERRIDFHFCFYLKKSVDYF